jgi:hypothetical protein
MKIYYGLLIFMGFLMTSCDEFNEDLDKIHEEIIWATVRSYNDNTDQWEPQLDYDGDTIKYIREIRRYSLGISGDNKELKEILYYNHKSKWDDISGIKDKDGNYTRDLLNWVDRSAHFEKGKFMGYSFYTARNEIDNTREYVARGTRKTDSLNDVDFTCPCKEFDSIPSIDEFSSKSGILMKYHFESNYKDRDRSSKLANSRSDKDYFILPMGWGEISTDKLFETKLYLKGKLYTGSMKFCSEFSSINICEVINGEIVRITKYDDIETISKKIISNYLAGELHGEYVEYHENGKIREQGNYKAGEQYGVWRSFESNGELQCIENYANGKRVDCEGVWCD